MMEESGGRMEEGKGRGRVWWKRREKFSTLTLTTRREEIGGCLQAKMGTARLVQLLLSLSLLASSVYLYLFVPDWWIYGLTVIVAGILNAFSQPGCPFWRFFASVVIVLGTIQTLFLVWSIRLVEQSPFFTADSPSSPSARDELFEGRLIVLPALATWLTISTRLGAAKHEGLLDALRTLLLLVFLVALVPAFVYSLSFFIPALANVVTHAIEQLPDALRAF